MSIQNVNAETITTFVDPELIEEFANLAKARQTAELIWLAVDGGLAIGGYDAVLSGLPEDIGSSLTITQQRAQKTQSGRGASSIERFQLVRDDDGLVTVEHLQVYIPHPRTGHVPGITRWLYPLKNGASVSVATEPASRDKSGGYNYFPSEFRAPMYPSGTVASQLPHVTGLLENLRSCNRQQPRLLGRLPMKFAFLG